MLAKTAGFCFGVNNAITTIFSLMEHTDKKIFTLGPIIHNQQMVNHLKNLGVNPTEHINCVEPPAYIVIRAHGVTSDVYKEIEKKGLTLVDATCPYVKKIHNLVMNKYKDGYKIIIVGDREHPEIIGINGWCNNEALVINDTDDLDKLGKSDERVAVVAQTTFNHAKWLSIVEMLKNKFINMEKYDTICNATRNRQKEAEELSKTVDMMVVIGSKESSNTQKLFEICKANCKRTYKIETSGDLPPVNIKEIKKVGITAGASTPGWIIKEVLNKMDELNKQDELNVLEEPDKQEGSGKQEELGDQEKLGGQEELNKEEKEEISFEEAFEDSIVTLRSGEVAKGKVISVGSSEVFVDLGYKCDGIIPFEELSDESNIKPEELFKPGMEIDVYIEKVNDGEGNVLLSKKRVDTIRGWDIIENAYRNKEAIKAKVFEVVKGGVLATSNGVRIFIPASQISDRYVTNFNEFLKQVLNIRIIEFNRNKNKVIGSRRILIEEERERLSNELWSNIEVGKKYTGKVKNLTKFGAFVDIGGVDGLIHLSELSWYKIKHPSEVVSVGDDVEVIVLDFDREKERISLGYKKSEDNPWNKVAEKHQVGDIITGKVVRLVPFGCFVQIDKSVDGLVHISQISNKRIAKPDDVLKIGQKVEAKIVEMDLENKKIGLSIKEVNPIDPVEEDVEEPEKDNSVYNVENKAEKKEEFPTAHREELSVTLGDVLGKLDLDTGLDTDGENA